MAQFDANFQKLRDLLPMFSAAAFEEDHKNFAVDEFKRFHSIAGTILVSFTDSETSYRSENHYPYSIEIYFRELFLVALYLRWNERGKLVQSLRRIYEWLQKGVFKALQRSRFSE